MKTIFRPAAAALFALSLAAAGCGGSGGSDAFSNLPPGSAGGGGAGGGSARAVAVNAVQGARRLNELLDTGFAGPTRAAAAPGHGWGRRLLATAATTLRRHNGARSRQEGTGAAPFFDSTLGLYATVAQDTDTTTRLNLFSDPAGQNAVGFFQTEVRGDPDQFPVTLVTTFDIRAGERPGDGTLTVVLNDADGQSGRITGRVRDTPTGLSLDLDLALSGAGASITGSVIVSDDDGGITFRNVAAAPDAQAGFTAELARGGGNSAAVGTLTQNADGSGTLTLSDQTGNAPLVAAWNEDGAGTLRAGANGAVETVADFDTEP